MQMKINEKMLAALFDRLRACAPGASYPLDPVERWILFAEIARLRAALTRIASFECEDVDDDASTCANIAKQALTATP